LPVPSKLDRRAIHTTLRARSILRFPCGTLERR